MTFCEKFNELIHDKRLTLNQISNDTKIPLETLKMYQDGIKKPNETDLNRLAAFFGIEVEDFKVQEIENNKIINPKYNLANVIMTILTFAIPFVFIIIGFINFYLIKDNSLKEIPLSIVTSSLYYENYVGVIAYTFSILNILTSLFVLILDFLMFIKIIKIKINVLLVARIINYTIFIITIFLIFFAINLSFYYAA